MLSALGRTLVVGLSLLTLAGCNADRAEEKARAAAERARDAVVPLDAGALDQDIPVEQVKKVQQQLTVLLEYMGPIDGRLDQVTLNALESFQRKNNIRADGRFNEETLELLEQAAARKG